MRTKSLDTCMCIPANIRGNIHVNIPMTLRIHYTYKDENEKNRQRGRQEISVKKMRVQGIIPRTGKLNCLNLVSFFKAKDIAMLQRIKNIANCTLDKILIA